MRSNETVRVVWVFAITVLLLSAGARGELPPPLWVSFESDSPGLYTFPQLSNDWKRIAWASLSNRTDIVSDPADGSGKALRVRYPAGSLGPGEGGAQFVVKLAPADEYWLGYRLRFAQGFDFRKGGKLPGLSSGGLKFSGGNIPKNGEGWTARYMWREDGRLMLYVYHAGMRGPWGDGMSVNARIQPDTWHALVQHVRLNTGSESNGLLEVWFDGSNVFSRSNLQFRLGTKGAIDSFAFSTFHGGNTDDFRCRTESFAFFDDFVIDREADPLIEHGLLPKPDAEKAPAAP